MCRFRLPFGICGYVSKRVIRNFADRLLYASLIGLTLVTGLALTARAGWPFELFTHFRVQYAFVALLLLLGFSVRRQRLAAAIAAVLLVLQVGPAAGRIFEADASTACSGPPLTIATVNLFFRNEDHRALLEWLDTASPDIVVVQEVTPQWAAVLSGLESYPFRVLVARSDPFGIGVISRSPLTQMQEADLAGDGLPSLAGTVQMSGRSLSLLAMHTHTPLTSKSAVARDTALANGADLLRSMPRPAIALGDLNATPSSPAFERFLNAAGVRDALGGTGWHPTWLAAIWPLALRIDHVLVSPDLCVLRAEVGPAIGSDHRPVLAQLRFAGN